MISTKTTQPQPRNLNFQKFQGAQTVRPHITVQPATMITKSASPSKSTSALARKGLVSKETLQDFELSGCCIMSCTEMICSSEIEQFVELKNLSQTKRHLPMYLQSGMVNSEVSGIYKIGWYLRWRSTRNTSSKCLMEFQHLPPPRLNAGIMAT